MADIQKLVQGLHPLERKVVPFLGKVDTLSQIAEKAKLQDVEAMRALQWLENKGVLKIHSETKETIELDANGKEYASKGLPEKRMLLSVKSSPVSVNDLMKKLGKDEFTIAVGVLKQKAAIELKEGEVKITPQGTKILSAESLEEKFIQKLSRGPVEAYKLEPEERFAFENLMKRKQIVQKKEEKIKKIELTDTGKALSKQDVQKLDFIERLTPELLMSGKWENKKFRSYDVGVDVPDISSSKAHFMKQAIDYIKSIWLEMGFEEMTGNYVETNFWDLDSLFVPQDHPARTMQDTFYVADETGKKIMKGKLPKIYEKVKAAHENGGDTGSKGWQTKWSEELAKEVIMRTHCTVMSARQISKLTKKDLPKKYFAVGRVFRNETMDWKHLFEFEQVEGIVVDENVNFRHLLGYLKQFFRKMGFTDVRLRPAHFPYTEPSVEVEVFNPVKQQWIELGGAGIFRPEVTKTLIGTEVPVLAWGLGLARIAAEYWEIQDIRETYKNDLRFLRSTKMFLK